MNGVPILSDDDIKQVIIFAITGGAGLIVNKLVNLLVKLTEPTRPLTAHAKFYLAMLFSLAVPGLIYLGAVLLGYLPFTLGYLLAVFGTAYAVSQSIHFEDTHPAKPASGSTTTNV